MEKILLLIQDQVPFMFLILCLMSVAVVIDLFTGIRKSKKRGKFTTSEGLRRTSQKLIQYVTPLLGFAVFDLILAIMPFYEIPWFTLAYGGFCTFTEAKSIFENVSPKNQKEEIKKSLLEILDKMDDKEDLIREIAGKVLN